MKILTDALAKLFLFPGALTQGHPESTVELLADDLMRYASTPTGEQVAVAVRRGNAADSPAVVFCYGNGMNLAAAVADLDWLAGEGRRTVAIPEYVGYGLSSGSPSEPGCIEAAEAAVAVLRNELGVPPGRMVLAGWSLGAAIALDLATRHAPAGLVLLSPFTSVADTAAALAPLSLRAFARILAGLTASQFDNRDKMARVTCPVLIAHGRRDSLVPFEMAEELAALVPVDRRTFVPVALAGHNDVFAVGGVALWRAYNRFCDDCLRTAWAAAGG